MPVFQRFESGNTFKVSATKATGAPLKKTERRRVDKPLQPSEPDEDRQHQPPSRAKVTLGSPDWLRKFMETPDAKKSRRRNARS